MFAIRGFGPRTLALMTIVGLTFWFSHSFAQHGGETETAAPLEPKKSDVESIDAIINAVYDVISGPADKERDWPRFRSLFVDGALLIPTAHEPDGEIVLGMMSPEDYAERASVFFKRTDGFYEREIGRKVDEYGAIAQVFSSYASFHEGEDKPFMRGINSFQLSHQGDRWAIVTILWEAESPDNPIPPEYLFSTDTE